jgi:hypothetical protein
MAKIRTIGEAYSAGWGIRMTCARGNHRGIVKIDPCGFETALSMETLVCARGRAFPLSHLASRLRCPNCGEEGIQVAFDVPGSALPVFFPQSPYRRSA